MEALKIETGRLGSSEAGMFKDEGSSLNAESRKGTSKVFDRWRQWNSEGGKRETGRFEVVKFGDRRSAVSLEG